METHAPARHTIVLLLAFTLVSVTLTIVAYRTIGGSVPLAPDSYRLQVPLPDAGNLVEGSEVDIAGVKIGHVQGVRRDGNRAIATLDINAGYAPIHADARAILRTKTLLGESYLELAPGAASAPPISDGGQLPSSQVRPAVTLDAFLNTFDPQTRQHTRQLFAGLATAVAGRGEALNEELGYAAPVSGNLQLVVKTMSEETGQLQQLFASSGIVLNAIGERQGALRGAVKAGDSVLSATAARDLQLSAVVHALPSFLDQLRATSDTLTEASGDFNRAIGALEPVAPLLPVTLSAIDRYAPQFQSLFEALPATVASGRTALPALTDILKNVPTAFSQLYPTSRQLIPVFQLLAAYREESLISALVDTGSVMNGTAVGPEGKIIHRANAALFFSNETPGGWIKRLPTNRTNPYPTPTGNALLSKLGFLKSYDCRNTGNILYLPPLGTGVPPCVTQGPWDYNGVTAYYPRLQPASP